jgi:hypothetical protein
VGSSAYGDAGSAGRGGPASRRRSAWRARATSCLGVLPASGRAASGSATRLGKARTNPEVECAVGPRRGARAGALGALAVATTNQLDWHCSKTTFSKNLHRSA